ncbi:hypothetical protein [Rhodococcus sp. IEGM1428]|uniref:hypothetical protein n=1 Tax=Rhodococcus sp. IEGM1428 TaxID=3392191 RepID=UPI003D10A7EE
MPTLHLYDSKLHFPSNAQMASFQVFVSRRFRRGSGGFFLGFAGTDSSTGTAQPVTQTYWIDPSSQIRFAYDPGDQVVVDEQFVSSMERLVDTDFGVQFADVPSWPFMVLGGGGLVDVSSDQDAPDSDQDESASSGSSAEQ